MKMIATWFRAVLHDLKEWPVREWVGIMAKFITFHWMLLFALSVALVLKQYAPAVEALSPIAKEIYDTALTVGMTWLGIGGAFELFRGEWRPYRLIPLIVQCVERLVFLLASLLVIRSWAPELVRLVAAIRQNPNESISVLIGCLIVYLIFSFSRLRPSPVTERLAYDGINLPPRTNPLLVQDIRRVAAHEVGHILLYAAASEVPDDLVARIWPEKIGMPDKISGRVWHSQPYPDFPTRGFLYWRMLLALAGNVAELSIFSDRGSGATSDNQTWLRIAPSYLAAGMGGEVYFVDSSDEMHIAHNRVVLNALKADHEKTLKEFFTLNEPLLRELTEVIMAKRMLVRKEIVSYLDRVIFTDRVKQSTEQCLD